MDAHVCSHTCQLNEHAEVCPHACVQVALQPVSASQSHQKKSLSSIVRLRKLMKMRSIRRKRQIKHKISAKKATSISSLPDEVLLDISYRVPLKSVLRFRCVSKGWNSLFSGHQFAYAHLVHSQNVFSNTFIMLRFIGSRLRFCSLQTLLHKPVVDLIDAEFDLNGKHMVGSCNGVICVASSISKPLARSKYDVILWNPCTRKHHEVPNSPFGVTSIAENYTYGFGFDKSTDDFKVVRFCSTSYEVSIYSVKTGKWKRIHDSWFEVKSRTKFWNGRIYFIMIDKDDEIGDWCIAYFDLETEQYGIIQKPTSLKGVFDVEGECDFDVKLDICEGGIYIICCDTHLGDLWNLNGYGLGEINEVWTKLVSVPHSEHHSPYELFQVMKSGHILLNHEAMFGILNMDDPLFHYPKFLDYFNEYVLDAISYVPSMVSPFLE